MAARQCLSSHEVAAPSASARSETPTNVAELPQIVAELRGMLEAKTGLNQSMFSALHQELKGYKDGFLLESVHRPIIRDLVSLYDDITGIQRQISATISDPDSKAETPMAVRMSERLRTIEMNLSLDIALFWCWRTI